jgi:uncharacterized membrane protein
MATQQTDCVELEYISNRHIRRRIVVIAVMTAIAVISRSLFFMMPQVKPMAAIVIITAVVLGPTAGAVTGMGSVLVSNFIFGQGIWTFWQMLGFALVGYFAGVLFHCTSTLTNAQLWRLLLYGALSVGVGYGLLVDTGTALLYSRPLNWGSLLACYASGLAFNVLHAVSTVVFLRIMARPIAKKLQRICVKYGL